MDRGLYIAASGMIAEQVRQDLIAADLANSSTPGYKADRSAQSSFGDLLLGNTATGQAVGALGLGTRIDIVRTSFAQAPLRETGNPLDLALEGDGFLAVQTGNGTRYTRDGQLVVDAQGRLATAGGAPVLGTDGRPIAVPADVDVAVAADGSVRAGGRQLGTLAVVSLANPQKIGDNLFAGAAGARPAQTAVRQGFLETSGVDPARAMVDMIVSMRAYEASQRVIRAIDESLQKGVAAGSPGAG